MNIFDELYHIYEEVDGNYSMIEAEAHSRGHHLKEAKYSLKRAQNDQAYFLYMFTRLEGRIRSLTKMLIKHKCDTITNPENKRAWLTIKQKKNLNLMDHVAFLTEKGARDYGKIFDYKKHRDHIAHGKTIDSIIVSDAYTEMKRLYHDLNS